MTDEKILDKTKTYEDEAATYQDTTTDKDASICENETFVNDTGVKENSSEEIISQTDETEFLENFPEDLSDFTSNETPSYTKLSVKYEDMLSSATTMFFVGLAGLIFLILVLCKVISIPIINSTTLLFDLILGIIFLAFMIAGIISYVHAKKIKVDADTEDELIAEITKWSDQNITRNMIDENLDLTEQEELLYFTRADKIKDMLMREFENADEALVIEMTEEIYQKIYEAETFKD